jgi:mannonate dehydratase
MNRRQFISSSGAAAALSGGLATGTASAAPAKRALMKVGTETQISDASLKRLARYSLTNVGGPCPVAEGHMWASLDELKQARDVAEKNGIGYDIVTPPILASSHIDRERHPAIMLAESPERDRDIEAMQTLIKNCAAAGIPAVKYNMSILGVLRLPGRVPGRGDATYSKWSLKEAKPATPLTKAGVVTADRFWERITYFLDHMVPVAEEYKIRLACHPQDPGVPPEGYQGVDRVLGTVDGLKKFISIKESPYHGLNFCQGTVSEMLHDPGKEIFDVIRYFGSRKKIFNVHFRNIRGHRDEFVETYPDEGSIDFVKAIQVYKEIDYSGMLMPDHVPQAPNDPGGQQSFAYCFGYIRALIQAVDQMS